MKKLFFERTLLFFISLTLVTLGFLFGSYQVLMKNYQKIEYDQNVRNINALLASINDNLSYVDRITTDTDLAKHQNVALLFIIENKLRNLKIDFIILEKTPNKRLSKFTYDDIQFQTNFEDFIIKKLKHVESQTTIVKYLDQLILVSKKKNLYMGRILTQESLENLSSTFMEIKKSEQLVDKSIPSYPLETKYFSNVHVKTHFHENNCCLINNIQFFNQANQFLFAIETKNKRIVVQEGKKTLLIFIGFVLIFLVIIFFITYKYQASIQQANRSIETRVDDRTKQIQNTMKELEKVNAKLYDLAHTDFLTKVRNRRNFFIHSQTAFNEALNSATPLSLLMIDIDNFKSFNDKFGHDLGDKVLVLFAECIKKHIPSEYIFGRLGGEEFAITMPNTTLNVAIEKAESLRREVEKIKIDTATQTLTITASFGASDIRRCKDIDHLLQKADGMLYSAKRSGKNIVRSRLTTV